MTNGASPPGWYRDPTGQGDARYWNGASWTELVHQGGRQVNVPIDPSVAQQPPVPGTMVQAPPTTTQYDAQPRSGGSSGGAIVALVIGLILIVVVIVAVGNADSPDEGPVPDTGVPATEAPPATEALDEGG